MTVISKVLNKINESVPIPKFREATPSEKKYEYSGVSSNIWIAEINDEWIVLYQDDTDPKWPGFSVEIINTETGDDYLVLPKYQPKNLNDAKKLAEFAAYQLANDVPIENLKQFSK